MVSGYRLGIFDVMAADTPGSDGSLTASTINIGYAEHGEINSTQCEVWHPPGIISIPALPNNNTGNIDSAQCIAVTRGDQNIAIAFRDTRTELLAGKLNPGETAVIASNSQARIVIKDDDSITMMTNDANSNLISFTFGPNGLNFISPFGSLLMDSTGFHVVAAGGASLHLGGINFSAIPGVPSLPGVNNSYAMINAGSFSANSNFVSLGPSTSTMFPVSVPINPTNPAGVPIPPFGASNSGSVFVAVP